jgi:hypothetical protein
VRAADMGTQNQNPGKGKNEGKNIMIDRLKVMQYYRRGYNYAKIANELICSKKQVGRIVIEERKELDKTIYRMAREGNEVLMWVIMHQCGFTVLEISAMTGVSRQFIFYFLIEFQEECE